MALDPTQNMRSAKNLNVIGAPWGYALGLLLFLIGASNTLRAEHFSGSSITYECVGGNIYNVYLDLYLDCSGAGITNQQLHFKSDCGLTFSVGTTAFPLTQLINEEASPLCASEVGSSTCNGGSLPGYRHYRYSTTLYLSPCDKWTMEWYICCRSVMVNLLNTPGSYAQATLNNSFGVCDISPRFVDSGVPHFCVLDPVSYSPGVSDADGSTMSFSLISARFGSPTPVVVSYNAGYTGASPIPGITIHPTTGQINFFPTISGNYVVVVQVTTYTPGGILIGSVMRDLMFVVLPCDGTAPVSTGLSNVPVGLLVGPNSVAACPGVSWCVDVVFTDSNLAQQIAITSNATSLLPGATFTVTGTNPAIGRLCWTNNSAGLPVNIFIQANDGACPIPNVASRSLFLNDCAVLPVELVGFDAKPERYVVRTNWSTASESENSHFIVERSRDGVEFDKIGTVEGAGTTQQVQHYEYVDLDPVIGVSYYRLVQVDMDGTQSFSDMVPVVYTKAPEVVVVPNEGGGWTVSGLTDVSDWSLVDLTGRSIIKGQFNGENTAFIPSPNIPPSLLVLVIHSGADQQQIKIHSFGNSSSNTESTSF